MKNVQFLAAIKEKTTSEVIYRPKKIKISKHTLSSEYHNLRITIPLTNSIATTVSNLFQRLFSVSMFIFSI